MSDYEQPLPWDLVRTALGLRAEGEPPSFEELVGEDLPIEQVAELWISCQEYQRAAKNVLDAVAAHLGPMIAEHGGVEVNAEWVTYGVTKTSRIKDEDGFWEWMAKNPGYMQAFNPNTIRKTRIPESVLDTFYEVVESPKPKLSNIPVYVLERNKRKREHERDSSS